MFDSMCYENLNEKDSSNDYGVSHYRRFNTEENSSLGNFNRFSQKTKDLSRTSLNVTTP